MILKVSFFMWLESVGKLCLKIKAFFSFKFLKNNMSDFGKRQFYIATNYRYKYMFECFLRIAYLKNVEPLYRIFNLNEKLKHECLMPRVLQFVLKLEDSILSIAKTEYDTFVL